MRLAVAVFLSVALLAQPAAAKKADKIPPGTVSQIQDERIKESSGIALSVDHEDLVYTINDRGTAAKIYAIKLSTGETVGTADISSLNVEDTESIAVDAKGTMWLGDLGDNDHVRNNVAIFSFPEPGPGNKTISNADRYPVEFPGGPVDVEGMLVHPTTSNIHLVSKIRDDSGTIFELPDLVPGTTAVARDLNKRAPVAVTDATYTHAGDKVLLRTNNDVSVFDPTNWEQLVQQDTPDMKQGESVAVERGDRTILIGSEGKNSPIVRLDVPSAVAAAGTTPAAQTTATGPKQSTAEQFIAVVGGGAVLLGLVALMRRRAKKEAALPNW